MLCISIAHNIFYFLSERIDFFILLHNNVTYTKLFLNGNSFHVPMWLRVCASVIGLVDECHWVHNCGGKSVWKSIFSEAALDKGKLSFVYYRFGIVEQT